MPKKRKSATCLWVETGEMWETACEHAFTLNDGTPADNDMKFCCYCGKSLEQLTEAEATDEDWP